MNGSNKQSGVILMISLIMLLLLTLIMISAVQVTSLEERMAGNLRDHNKAFQAAESALREAEAFIETQANNEVSPFVPLNLSGAPFRGTSPGEPDENDPDCVNGFCRETNPLQSEIFPNVNGTKLTATTGISDIDKEPEYIIELIHAERSSFDLDAVYATFRITALAWGGDSGSAVRLQSTYRVYVTSTIL